MDGLFFLDFMWFWAFVSSGRPSIILDLIINITPNFTSIGCHFLSNAVKCLINCTTGNEASILFTVTWACLYCRYRDCVMDLQRSAKSYQWLAAARLMPVSLASIESALLWHVSSFWWPLSWFMYGRPPTHVLAFRMGKLCYVRYFGPW